MSEEELASIKPSVIQQMLRASSCGELRDTVGQQFMGNIQVDRTKNEPFERDSAGLAGSSAWYVFVKKYFVQSMMTV